MRWWLAGVCLACGAAAAQDRPAPAGVPVRVDPRYAGKYAGQPWMRQTLQALPATVARACRRACAGLGVDPAAVDWTAVRVDVRDAVPEGLPTWKRYTGPALETAGYPPPRGRCIRMRIHAEPLRNGYIEDLETELVHEAVHAVQRATCPRYRGCPKWMREGLALAVAGQGPHRVHQLLADGRFALDPGRLLNGLEEPGARHTLNDYAEDFLAVQYLEVCGGPEALRTLQAALQAGGDWREALAKAAGRDWPLFRTEALAHARTALAAAQTADVRAYVTMLRARPGPQRLALAARLLREHPESDLTELAHYYSGSAHRDAKAPAEAIAAYTRSLAGGTRFGLEDDAVYWIGSLAYRQGDFATAAVRWAALVRDHPGSSWLGQAALGWGVALHRLGKTAEARRVCAKALRSFPKHRARAWVAAAQKIVDGE